jgi:hypothetical protein
MWCSQRLLASLRVHFGIKQCIKPTRLNSLLCASLLVKLGLGRKLGTTEEVWASEVGDALEGVRIGSHWHNVVVNLKQKSSWEFFDCKLWDIDHSDSLAHHIIHFHVMLIASCPRTLESWINHLTPCHHQHSATFFSLVCLIVIS